MQNASVAVMLGFALGLVAAEQHRDAEGDRAKVGQRGHARQHAKVAAQVASHGQEESEREQRCDPPG